MNRILTGIALATLLASSGAFAQSMNDQNMGTSSTSTGSPENPTLSNETFTLKPEVGAMTFTNALGSDNTRGAAGLDMELNLTGLMAPGTPIYTGIQTGIVYSHLGSASSGFFGSVGGDANASAPGANLLLIPADVKIGWNAMDNLRLSVHGGGNIIYRSSGSSVALGPSSGTTASVWNIFPNAGADLDYAITPRFTLLIRPDWTVSTGSPLFTAMIGLGFSLG